MSELLPQDGSQGWALFWLVVMAVLVLWALVRLVLHLRSDPARLLERARARADDGVAPFGIEPPRAVLDVRCPACDTGAGEDCITVNGWGCHLQRYEAAREKAR